jgi:hypothetical protein
MNKLLGSPDQKPKSEVRSKLSGAKPISSSEIRSYLWSPRSAEANVSLVQFH